MQVRALKAIQKQFGGTVYDPIEDAWEFPEFALQMPLTEQETRCARVHRMSYVMLAQMHGVLLSARDDKLGETYEGVFPFSMPGYVYNAMVPLLVTALESFLRDYFIAFIEGKTDKVEEVWSRDRKISYSDVRQLVMGKRTIVEYEADNYSFQNFDSVDKAYKRYVGLKPTEVWEREDEGGLTLETLEELLTRRHKLVHEAALDEALGCSDVVLYKNVVHKAIDDLVEAVFRKTRVRSNHHKWL